MVNVCVHCTGADGLVVSPALAARKPNILVIWVNDVGVHEISAYNQGIMCYKTPNIDRIEERSCWPDRYRLYPDGMVEHDVHVGVLLKKLDNLGIADNTIVIYSTDNGAEKLTYPDGGTTPIHEEKGTT